MLTRKSAVSGSLVVWMLSKQINFQFKKWSVLNEWRMKASFIRKIYDRLGWVMRKAL